MTFRPQLDGLRGLFVAAVFLFHSQFLACGWVGGPTRFRPKSSMTSSAVPFVRKALA